MTTIFRRHVVAGAEHAVVGGQGDQRRGDRRAVVAADRQDGGEVVADVLGMGQGFAVGLGLMGAEAERRPVVNGEQNPRPRGHFLPHHRVHRFDQGRLLDARVDAKPPQLLGEGSRLEPGDRGPGPRRSTRPGFPEAFDEDGVSVLERTHELTRNECMRGYLTHSPTLVETNGEHVGVPVADADLEAKDQARASVPTAPSARAAAIRTSFAGSAIASVSRGKEPRAFDPGEGDEGRRAGAGRNPPYRPRPARTARASLLSGRRSGPDAPSCQGPGRPRSWRGRACRP